MADKTETFVKARRRSDGVVMVLGRRIIKDRPHIFEEIFEDEVVAPDVDITIEKVTDEEEVFDISDDDVIPEDEEIVLAEPETVGDYRKVLDQMGVSYLPQHGIPGLKKIYEENK